MKKNSKGERHETLVSCLDTKKNSKQAADSPNQYWLEPVVSFELQNTLDSQLDLTITSKAFKFRSFIKVEKFPVSNNGADQLLFQFYLKHMRMQYETGSASKITTVKVTRPIEIDSFPNAKFKFVKGSVIQFHEFTLTDLSCINPYDWIILYNLLLRYAQKTGGSF
ncbi:unnamed protein product [Lactuca saligna]|uniref:Uncharacterized protein n=1 Tax=Lactuca saligna TaxID=75948 RepID=A0AA35ZN36_LACSI|nr:unnamed protein product [Lactuca saligna]